MRDDLQKTERGGWLSRFGMRLLGALQNKPVYQKSVNLPDKNYRKFKHIRKIAKASRRANR